MHIWYVNHYAVPEEISLGGRAQYIGRELARHGHTVTIFGASKHHFLGRPCGSISPGEKQSADGYSFRVVSVPGYNGNGLRRIWNMLAFARAMKREIKEAQKNGAAPDVIIVSSPHPWAWKPLRHAARKNIRMVFEERDFWPQSLIEVAGVSKWHPLVMWLNRLMSRIYKEADAVVSLFPATNHPLAATSRQNVVHCIPNGIDQELWGEAMRGTLPDNIASAFATIREQGKLVVCYAGSMGPPNALETLLKLGDIQKPAKDRPYHFILIGDGISRPALELEAARRQLDFLTFLPPVRREEAWLAMRNADILYFSLQNKPNLYRHGISLNKLFEYLMAGRPVLQVLQGGNHPVADSGGGFELNSDDPAVLDDALCRMAVMPAEEREEMGRRAQSYALANHNWSELGNHYAKLCEQLHSGAL